MKGMKFHVGGGVIWMREKISQNDDNKFLLGDIILTIPREVWTVVT